MNSLSVFLACFVALVVVSSAELVPTPTGLRPRQCVHKVESGVFLKPVASGVEVHHKNGTIIKLPALPECIEWDNKLQKERALRRLGKRNVSSPADGWLDNAGYYPPAYLSTFYGNYQVPPNPSYQGSQVLFYFIGTENFQTGVGVTILQPVLTWGNGITGWSIASWNCCPSGQAHESTPLTGFASGAILGGYIDKSAGDTYSVVSNWGSQKTTLNIATAGRVFDWTDVTLETYGVTTCGMFPSGPMTFSAMQMTLVDGDTPTPAWSPSGATECNGRLTVNSPSNIVIQHN